MCSSDLNFASQYFNRPVTRADVVWTYSGVRPLYDDGASKAQEATRDYVLTLEADPGLAPLLSVFGGKITTHRRLAEAVLEKLAPHLPDRQGAKAGWTGQEPLPGGDFPAQGFDILVSEIQRLHPYLSQAHAWRLARAYGTRAKSLLEGAQSLADLGPSFGSDLTEREVLYLAKEEWALTADDVLWRRSKLGLRLDTAAKARLAEYMQRLQTPANQSARAGA